MTEREKIAQIIAEHLCPQGKAHKTLYGAERRCYSRDNFAECEKVSECVDALIAAGIALRGERMKYERLTKKICGYYHGKRFVGGKGVINDREYCRGCFDATAIVDRLGELEDKIEAGTLVELAEEKKDE